MVFIVTTLKLFDEILQELTTQDLILSGELIQPNFFRITISSSNLLQCYDIVRKFKYHLQGISLTDHKAKNYLEYFFTLFTSDRELLFSIDVFLDGKSSVVSSLAAWEPTALVYEEIIKKTANIDFVGNSRNLALFVVSL